MKTILFYLDFFCYMIFSLFKKNKLESMKKNGTKEEAESYLNTCVKRWASHVVNKVGINIEIVGKENLPDTTCLYVANHQGYFDIPVLIASLDTPIGFIAKKEILKFKIVSYWMKQIKCIFMDRENIRESVKSINEGIRNLKGGYSMVIFPEGTRSKGPKIGEFKKGSMKLALKSGVSMVPVTINGTYKLREGNKRSAIKSGNVKLTIHEKIDINTLSKEQKLELADTLKKIIKTSIEE